MRARLLPLLLSLGLVAACDAGTLELDDPPDPVGPDAAVNPAADAAPGGGPLEARVQGADLLYHFAGGVAGQTVVSDRSGQLPAYDIAVADPLAITWNLSSASIVAPTIITNPLPATRVRDACAAAGTVTMEAWVRTGDLEQTGTIMALEETANTVSVRTMQNALDFDTYLRTAGTAQDGSPALARGPVDAVNMQHFVYMRQLENGTQSVYLNNLAVPPSLDKLGGTGVWPNLSQFAIAADIGVENPWIGEIALVAVYCRVLSEAEILQNYNAGY